MKAQGIPRISQSYDDTMKEDITKQIDNLNDELVDQTGVYRSSNGQTEEPDY